VASIPRKTELSLNPANQIWSTNLKWSFRIFGYTLKTIYRKMKIYFKFSWLLAIQNLQNQFILQFSILISLSDEILPIEKRADPQYFMHTWCLDDSDHMGSQTFRRSYHSNELLVFLLTLHHLSRNLITCHWQKLMVQLRGLVEMSGTTSTVLSSCSDEQRHNIVCSTCLWLPQLHLEPGANQCVESVSFSSLRA
jgi:hypothetical protein